MRRLAIITALAAIGCSSRDDRPAAWGYISPAIFQPACATSSCHSRGIAVGGVDFSDPDRGYNSLTAAWFIDAMGTPEDGCEPWHATMVCPGKPLVTAYDPGQSRLVSMLRARGAARMPPDRPLPEVDIALVESWILDGARKTVDGPPAPTARPDAGVIGGGGDGGTTNDGGGTNDGGTTNDGGATNDGGGH